MQKDDLFLCAVVPGYGDTIQKIKQKFMRIDERVFEVHGHYKVPRELCRLLYLFIQLNNISNVLHVLDERAGVVRPREGL